MPIQKFYLRVLRNEQHYQFHTEFKQLVEQHTAKTLKIEKEFAQYIPIYQKEDDTLKVIRKSAITESVSDADAQRDTTLKGLANSIKIALQHFKPDVREAAKRVDIIFTTYGDITRKPYDEESAAITNILQGLQGKYAQDIATIGLADWVQKLADDNTHFLSLVKERYDDLNLDMIANMPEARKHIDHCYGTIIDRINALIIVEGEEQYKPFAESLNQRIAHYRTVFTQRQGRAEAKKSKEEGEIPKAVN